MDFDGFARFCADFEIFPYVLSKPKIMRFFRSLSSFYKNASGEQSQINKVDQKPKEMIDEHLFVEALALTAFEISYMGQEKPSNAQRIILLMNKLNLSEGPAKIMR